MMCSNVYRPTPGEIKDFKKFPSLVEKDKTFHLIIKFSTEFIKYLCILGFGVYFSQALFILMLLFEELTCLSYAELCKGENKVHKCTLVGKVQGLNFHSKYAVDFLYIYCEI